VAFLKNKIRFRRIVIKEAKIHGKYSKSTREKNRKNIKNNGKNGNNIIKK